MPDTINVDNLCMGCMSVLEDSNVPCPRCGFDIKNYDQSIHQLKPYTILNGKYLVGKVLGEGGFGITYLGWDLNLDIKIAIKEYYPSGLVTREITSTGNSSVKPFSGDKREYYQNGLDKFVNEAKSLAKFYTLPGIVAVKDFFRENGTAYIVMEFVNGITLKQHLANSGDKLQPNEVFELMRPLMKSLSQIHAEGVIHRDISPDNIMITNKGDIKLLDFGAARDFISDINRSLSVLLKPGYAPEEQYRTKGHQGPWTDVYGLCATIYKMITGITPPESLERLASDELVPPSKMGIKLSLEVENALLKGLAVFQKDRYQSINELCIEIYNAKKNTQSPPGYQFEQSQQDNTIKPVKQETDNPIPVINNNVYRKTESVDKDSITTYCNMYSNLNFLLSDKKIKPYLIMGIIGIILNSCVYLLNSITYVEHYTIISTIILSHILTLIFLISCFVTIRKWSLVKFIMLLSCIGIPVTGIYLSIHQSIEPWVLNSLSLPLPVGLILSKIHVKYIKVLSFIAFLYGLYLVFWDTTPLFYFDFVNNKYLVEQVLLLLLLVSLAFTNLIKKTADSTTNSSSL